MAKASNVRAWARILAVATFVASLQILNISLATPAAAVQDDLTASMEAPGIWTPPSSFTDLITESFDSRTTLASGTSLSIGTVANMANQTISAQSRARIAVLWLHQNQNSFGSV
jgi:hypothetical protein